MLAGEAVAVEAVTVQAVAAVDAVEAVAALRALSGQRPNSSRRDLWTGPLPSLTQRRVLPATAEANVARFISESLGPSKKASP